MLGMGLTRWKTMAFSFEKMVLSIETVVSCVLLFPVAIGMSRLPFRPWPLVAMFTVLGVAASTGWAVRRFLWPVLHRRTAGRLAFSSSEAELLPERIRSWSELIHLLLKR